MADEPISALATFPASPTSATGTSADEIELLDINDTTMASSGTNKRVNMADFFSTFVTAGSNITVTKQTTGGGVSIASTGTVTSVSWTGDGTIFTASADTPVTTSGTLTPASLIAQTKNYMLAGPTTGSNAAPTFRALAVADLPTTGLAIASHYGTITTDTESGSAVTCNLSTSDLHLVVLNNNVAIAISNPTVGQQFVVVLQQAASGGPYSVSSWFSGSTVTWMGAPYTAPTTPNTASAYLVATFLCISSGVYLAWWLGNSAT